MREVRWGHSFDALHILDLTLRDDLPEAYTTLVPEFLKLRETAGAILLQELRTGLVLDCNFCRREHYQQVLAKRRPINFWNEFATFLFRLKQEDSLFARITVLGLLHKKTTNDIPVDLLSLRDRIIDEILALRSRLAGTTLDYDIFLHEEDPESGRISIGHSIIDDRITMETFKSIDDLAPLQLLRMNARLPASGDTLDPSYLQLKQGAVIPDPFFINNSISVSGKHIQLVLDGIAEGRFRRPFKSSIIQTLSNEALPHNTLRVILRSSNFYRPLLVLHDKVSQHFWSALLQIMLYLDNDLSYYHITLLTKLAELSSLELPQNIWSTSESYSEFITNGSYQEDSSISPFLDAADCWFFVKESLVKMPQTQLAEISLELAISDFVAPVLTYCRSEAF